MLEGELEKDGEQSITIQTFHIHSFLNLQPLSWVKGCLMFIGVCHSLKVLLEIGTIQAEVRKSRYQPKITMPVLPRRKEDGRNIPPPQF